MSLVTLKQSNKQLFVESSGEGPALVFLHGLGSSTTFWSASLELSQLAKTRRLVKVDLDGHGLSPVSSPTSGKGGKLGIDDLVQDLRQLLDALGIDRAAGLCGHSMSGVRVYLSGPSYCYCFCADTRPQLVCATFASLYPERVSKLFLLGPVKAMPAAACKNMLHRAALVREGGMPAVVDTVVAGAVSAPSRERNPLSPAIVRALLMPTKPEGYARACEALAEAQDPDWDKVGAQETLIVGGELDYLVKPEDVDFLTTNIKRARSVTLKGCGHWHAVEQPEAVAKLLSDFFA